MATGDDNNKGKEGKGFAGLSSLVSDVDTTQSPIPEKSPAGRESVAPSAGRPNPSTAQPTPSPKKQPYVASSAPTSGLSAGKWILSIAAAIGFLWFIVDSNKYRSSQVSAPTTSGTSTSLPQAPTRPEEVQPPVGQNLVLSMPQIRFCLAEDIRMEAAKSALNGYSDEDVDRFNAMVSDYNSRCGSFRYRSGALESARRDVESHRGELQTEGRSRFIRSPTAGALSDPTPSRPAPDATVHAIQLQLNELGYDAGTPDGLMGSGTRSAIIAFQRDRGMSATGVANEALISQLQQALPRSDGGSGANELVAQEPQSRPSTIVAAPSAPSPRPTFAEAPTTPLSQPPSTEESILAGVHSAERAAIENACGYHKRNSGPADYYGCLRRELASLTNSGGRPDLSRASASEQASIENACGYQKRNSGPGDYYDCLRRELAALASSAGRPDLSRASPSERSAIENACGYHKRNTGPGDYYDCLRREMTSLSRSGGPPDLSRASASEQSAIENACGYHKRNTGPSDYYECMRREMASLSKSGGRPDLSGASESEQAAIENACGYHRRNSGPGDYYSCLRSELSKLAYR